MKRILLFFAIIYFASSAFAQSPEIMSYQAVIRNASGLLITEKPIGIRIRILQKTDIGNSVYVETHSAITNKNGLATIKIGAGTVVSGNLSSIDWSDGPYFLQIETDPAGGTSYSINNVSQMLSVPYALYAKKAGDSGGWSLKGNVATPEDYIGTNNNQPLVFKAYGGRVGYLGGKNIFLGDFSGGDKDNGQDNIGIGYGSLYGNISGNYNVGIGKAALQYNTTGIGNMAFGYSSLSANTTGNWNVALGYTSLYQNTTGSKNVAIGSEVLFQNETGHSNTALGYNSLYSNKSGYSNVAIGVGTLIKNTTTSNLVAIGDSALYYNTGIKNTAVGSKALFSNTEGNNNTANGYNALYKNTIGNYNVATGTEAMNANTTGQQNVAIGYQSLYVNTIGDYNTATGHQSLNHNTEGSGNAANGFQALSANTTGNDNNAMGFRALYSNRTGDNNVAVGTESLFNNSTGGSNAGIGLNALKTNTTGGGNTAVGAQSDVSAGNLNNATAIGFGAIANASNKVRIGNTSITKIEGQVAFSFPSDARFKYNIKNNVPGLDFIKKLQPVTYYFDNEKLDEFTKTGVINNNNVHQVSFTAEKELHTGFLAQDVEKIANELGYHFDGVRAPANDKDHYSLAYSQFIMPLVKGMQEQQVLIEKLQSTIDRLEQKLEELANK